MFADRIRTIKPASGGGGAAETIGSTDVGAATNGGYYAGTITDGGVTYHLIAVPKGGIAPMIQWDSALYNAPYCDGYDTTDQDECYDNGGNWIGINWQNLVTTGITNVTNGPNNTATLSAGGYGTRHSAALYCVSLNVGGKTDWYLPAKNELAVLYAAKAAFSAAGQAFISDYYWSSTECDTQNAWYQSFSDGYKGIINKTNEHYVRAVRRFPV